jgi:putative membrane protein
LSWPANHRVVSDKDVSDKDDSERKGTAMMGYGWGMGFAGWIFMVLFWIVVIGGVVWAVVTLLPGSRAGTRGQPETPEEILDRRFALGELDAEQYRRAREELAATHTVRR